MKPRWKWADEKPENVKDAVSTVLQEVDPRPKVLWECVACPLEAKILHKGTAYCRLCYDERNRLGKLVN